MSYRCQLYGGGGWLLPGQSPGLCLFSLWTTWLLRPVLTADTAGVIKTISILSFLGLHQKHKILFSKETRLRVIQFPRSWESLSFVNKNYWILPAWSSPLAWLVGFQSFSSLFPSPQDQTFSELRSSPSLFLEASLLPQNPSPRDSNFPFFHPILEPELGF